MKDTVYTTPEHEALREQVARFLEREVEPFGEQWEEQGYTPREVLRKMGSLGWFGMTYPSQYGGAEADVMTSVVFQEALSLSTFGGFIVTVNGMLSTTAETNAEIHISASPAKRP